MVIKVNGKVVVCVECGKDRCWKKGLVPSRGGQKQRFICYDCGRSFYLDSSGSKVKKKKSKKKLAEVRLPGQPGEPVFVDERGQVLT